MIVILAVLFRLFLRGRLLGEAREQADRGLRRVDGGPRRDGHVRPAATGSFARRLLSGAGFTVVSPRVRDGVGRDHAGPGDRAADRGRDRGLGAGLVLAGVLLRRAPAGREAVGTADRPGRWRSSRFVCSIGNVPLAVVLWKGGISFGGVVAFIFADLIIAPILNIYRKYYGGRMAAVPARHASTPRWPAAGYVVELVFGGLGLIPDRAAAHDPRPGRVLELHHLAQHRLPGRWPPCWSSGSCAPAACRCCG